MRLRLRTGCWCVLAALLILLAGCGAQAATSGTRTPGASATGTPAVFRVQATPVTVIGWRVVMLPQQVKTHQITGMAVSPVDGQDAWLCVQMSATSMEVWATRDFGMTWADIGALPRVTSVQGQSCTLVADANSAGSLAAVVNWGSGDAGTLESATLISTDSGAHWSRVAGNMQLMALASQGGTSYAILHDPASPLSLFASTDGLHTWRSITPPGLATGDGVFAFWLRPASTEMIAATNLDTLWRSMDGGAIWTRINTPHMQVSEAVWQASASHWVFCGTVTTAGGIACSTDLGQTWPVRQNIPGCFANAMLADGALLAACPPNGGGGTQPDTLYELPWGASTWTNLGVLPYRDLFAATPAGQLWCGSLDADALDVTTLPA